jgi:cell division transport system permease protein
MIFHVCWRLVRRAVVNLWRAPLPSLVAVLTMALALFLGAGFLAALAGAKSLLRTWGAEATIALYLAPGETEAQGSTLADKLRSEHAEVSVVFVDRAQALARLREDMRDQAGALDGVSPAVLPMTLELTPRETLQPSELRLLAESLGKLPEVIKVDYGSEWLDALEAFGRGLRAAAASAIALVLGAAILVIANTIRLAVYARRDEIEIMKLVGATDGYVRLPFLLEGALQGIAGALLALLGLYAVERVLIPRAQAAFAFTAAATIGPVLPIHLAAMIAFGAAVGLLGSWLAVARFLRT